MTESKLISKHVSQQLKQAKTLASAHDHYRDSVAPAWTKLLGVTGAAALATLLQELAARTADGGDALERAEQTLNLERQDDEPMREARDDASAALNKTLISVKGIVTSSFGEGALVTYGLSGSIPDTPDARRTYARNASALLRKHPAIAHDALGRETRSQDIALLLDQAAQPLDAHRADETREALELTAAISQRDAAAADLAALSSFGRSLLDGSLRLAGQHQTADKLANRLNPRTPGGADEDLPTLEPIPQP